MTPRPLSAALVYLSRAAWARDAATMTDGQLLESYLNGRRECAFEAIVRRHGPMVLRVCRRVLHNWDDAEDAFQATFLVLVRKAHAIVPRDKLVAWLCGTAHRTALQARTAAARRRAKEMHAGALAPAQRPEGGTWEEWEPLLDGELARLPDKYRLPVLLCDLQGMTRKEAARHLGWPEGSLSWRLARARSLLARRLFRYRERLAGAAPCLPNFLPAVPPVRLVASTVHAATELALGPTAGITSVPSAVSALTARVLKAMLVRKVATGGASVCALVALFAAPGALVYHRLTSANSTRAAATPAGNESRPAAAANVSVRTFPCGSQAILVVDLGNGDIDVVAESIGVIEVCTATHARGYTHRDARYPAGGIEVSMVKEGDSVRVNVRAATGLERARAEASVRVRVPPGTCLDLRTGKGTVTVKGKTGKVRLQGAGVHVS
jgi:RNA polymerase sigma factor (sigma-70 family)